MSQKFYHSTLYKCSVHGTFGNTNVCPWPNCPNGVTEDTIDVSILVSEKSETYHRISWDDLNGETFYEWQAHKMPSWFSISRAYFYFANRMTKHISVDQMFHYTSADGALAILQSGSLRFTDYAYLNDTREVTYGVDLVRSLLEVTSVSVDSDILIGLRDEIEDADPFSPYNIYTASFSSDFDSLSQFRLYGPIALGFEANPNGFGYFKGEIHAGHVVYDPAVQAKLVSTFFHLVKQSEQKDAERIKNDPKQKLSTSYLVGHLLRIVALFKHPAFGDEREVRLLYSEPLEIMDQFGQELAHRNFRTSGGLIVPFTNTNHMIKKFRSDPKEHEDKRLPLKSVVIGPMGQADVLARGMRDLLSNLGYHDVEVSLSEAPLRT